jgi:hypothetical protein
MRSQWNFHFESNDLRIEGVHKFVGDLTRTNSQTSPPTIDKLSVELTLEPDPTPRFPGAQHTGVLKITLPGNMDETQDAVYWLARHASEHISFFQGELKLDGSFVWVEALPDSPEEAEKLGENRFSWTLNMRRAESPEKFNPKMFPRIGDVATTSALRQFNSALSAKNPIDQFLGLFKILENAYAPRKGRQSLATRLKGSHELVLLTLENLKSIENGSKRAASEEECLDFLDDLARIRNQCAHLQTSVGFGFRHGDPMVANEVEPLIEPLAGLAWETIRRTVEKPI